MATRAGALVLVALAALFAGTGCYVRESEDFLVTVAIQIPKGVTYNQVRLVKSARGNDSDRTKPVDGTTGFHVAGLYLPRDGGVVRLKVQALLDQEVRAQVVEEIDPRAVVPDDTLELSLTVCATPFDRQNAAATCTPQPDAAPPDQGDAGADEPTMDTGETADTADAGAETFAPSCPEDAGDVDAGDAQPVIAAQPPGTPACETYCERMEMKCPEVFRTRDHCRLACAEIAWPEKGEISGDNLVCRSEFARGLAINEATRRRHCQAASPNSETACGGHPCAVYCRTGAKLCPGHFPPLVPCIDACLQKDQERLRMQPPVSLYVWSLHCRFDWLERAVFDRQLCGHAAPSSCGPCRELVLSLP